MRQGPKIRRHVVLAAGTAAGLLAALPGCPKHNDKNARNEREARSEELVSDMDRFAEPAEVDSTRENTEQTTEADAAKPEPVAEDTGGEAVDPTEGPD